MFATLRPALTLLALFSVVTGVAYPLVTTGIAQALFPDQSSGSLVQHRGRDVGSRLIGQGFGQAGYFWGRPSATASPYDGAASSGSNLGPLNPALRKQVEARVKALRDADPTATGPVPVDLVTASGSGLDPDISVAAALFQLPRVAQARQLAPERVRALIDEEARTSASDLIGEPRVNVLRLNLALDRLELSGA